MRTSMMIALATCLILAVHAGEPSILPKAADTEIAVLLRQLESGSFASRARATNELAHIGAPAIEPLRQFAAKTPSLEARRRAQHLAAKLRYLMFDGGDVVDGYQAILRSERDEYRSDEPVEFLLEIRNVCLEDIEMYQKPTWSFIHYYVPTKTPVRVLFEPSDGGIHLLRHTGVKPPAGLSMIACSFMKRKEVTQKVAPGDGLEYPITLTEHGRLDAGDYEATVRVDLPFRNRTERVVSNVVRFKVVGTKP